MSTTGGLAVLRARSVGVLTDGTLRPNESLDVVWQHLCDGLRTLAESGGDEQLKQNENGLSQRLMIILERPPYYRPYFFRTEDMEDDRDGHSPRADIVARARDGGGVVVNGIPCAGGDRFLVLEAKRLPTPEIGREREYLTGKRGGVSRFKQGLHARDLKTVGIIAYVQRHAFDYWKQTINRWVDELIADSTRELPWDEQDRLELEEASSRLARLRSNNLRVLDSQRLVMRHIWVQLAN